MPNKVGHIPEFSQDASLDEQEVEEVKEEKETPSESSTEEKPVEETTEETSEEGEKPSEEEESEEIPDEDNRGTELAKQIQGLETERSKLLEDIKSLRGERRDLKEKQLEKVEKLIEDKTDDLSDVEPQGVALVERVLKAKGYVKKDEMSKIIYGQVKQQQLNTFLDEFPEFKPENDPDDKNWSKLQEEMKFYRMPEDPQQIGKILRKARKNLNVLPIDQVDVRNKERSIDLAGKGGAKGKSTRSSSSVPFNEDQIDSLRRGGWTDEEIKNLEKSK